MGGILYVFRHTVYGIFQSVGLLGKFKNDSGDDGKDCKASDCAGGGRNGEGYERAGECGSDIFPCFLLLWRQKGP